MNFIKKYIKSVTALCLVFALMCPIFLPAFGTRAQIFDDVREGDWHYAYIMPLAESGILQGMTPTTFEPSGKLTAAQLLTLVTRFLGLEERAQTLARQNDVWFYGYAAALCEKGIIDKSDFKLEEKDEKLVISSAAYEKLNSPVRRDMTAKIITEAFEYDRSFIVGGGYDEKSLSLCRADISDYEKIPQNMREYVVKCYYNGIFNGYDDGSFKPEGFLTRAEAAKIISTVLNYSQRERVEHRDLPPTAVVTDNDYAVDQNDNRALKTQKITDVLWQISNGLAFDTDAITLKIDNIVPAGYVAHARFYTEKDGVYENVYHAAPSDFPAAHICRADGERAVILYLKNSSADGRVDGYAEFRADKSGKIYHSYYCVR